jgi:hypothetical protein
VEEIAFLLLFGIFAARNDVYRQAPVTELIERRELTGGKGRRDEARAMRKQKFQPRGLGSGEARDLESIGAHGKVTDQSPVESRMLVSVRNGRKIGLVYRGSARLTRFRDTIGVEHSDEFD